MENDNIILICRHSERIDYSKERLNQKSNKGDPELTNNGIILAKYLGKNSYKPGFYCLSIYEDDNYRREEYEKAPVVVRTVARCNRWINQKEKTYDEF